MNVDQGKKLRAFAASSNWSMLLHHQSDVQNWERFMEVAKANPNDIADGEVYGVIKGVTTNPCPDDIAGRMEYLCRRGKQGRIKRFVVGVKELVKDLIGFACLMMPLMLVADIKVSDVEVFSGYPWKEVVVGYTITGTDANADIVRLTATDKTANKNYTAKELAGAKFTEGRHVLRWNAASEGVKFSSANVVFAVSVVKLDGVQLWEDGPYWAECNVGATKPEDDGYYFWWGDTVGYKRNAANNGWSSVVDSSAFSFSIKDCPTYRMSNEVLQAEGYIDATGSLVAAHDAAAVHLGAPWRMPTSAEVDALISNCTTTWTTHNGVYGRLITGKGAYASRSIFLPAAGSGDDAYLESLGLYGNYWSSSPNSSSPGYARSFYFYSGDFSRSFDCRYYGQPVRPVRGFAK